MNQIEKNTTNNSLIANSQFNKIVLILKKIFKSLGLISDEINISTNFLELGLESLALIQISRAVQQELGVKVNFRLLLEEFSTIETLGIHIANQLPPEETKLAHSFEDDKSRIAKLITSELSTNNDTKLNSGSTSDQGKVLLGENISEQTTNTAIQRLITQQLQVMSKQLDLLHKGSSTKKKMLTPSHMEQSTSVPESTQVIEVFTEASQSQENQVEFAQQQLNLKIENKTVVESQRIEKGESKGLNPQQQKYIDALIERVVKRTQESKRLTQAARPFLANPRTITGFRLSIKEMLYPLHIQRGSGARIWDVDDNEYIDLSMGFGPLLFGHSPSFVIEAIHQHIQQGMQNGPQSYLTAKVAELFCELTGQERVAFCNDGTEAVMGAIRIARASTKRSKIAIFAGSYHGNLDEVLVAGVPFGDSKDETLGSLPSATGIPQHMAEQVIVLNYGSPKSLEILKAKAHELAAVLVEPVQSQRPDFQPQEFLRELRKLTQQTGIVLIFDEVITGFRMHPGGIQALWDIQADITTYGKAIGSGLPMGVIAGKAAFMDVLDGGFWNYEDASYPQVETTRFAGTFFKNPLGLAVVWAILKHLKNSGTKLQEELARKTQELADSLNIYFQQKQLPIQVVHFGSLFRFAYPPNIKWMNLLFYHLLEKGIYIWEGRSCFLSTEHTHEDIEQVIRAVKESILQMQEGGFLPTNSILINDDRSSSHQVNELSNTQTDLLSNLRNEPSPTTSSTCNNKNISSIRNVPLIEAQKQLWFLAQMGDEVSRAYNQSSIIHLRESFNLKAAHKAIQEVVNRHEALRTSFSPQGDYQQIHSTLIIDVPLIDLSTLDNSKREAHLSEFLAQEARQTFDLEKGPLLRTQIVKLGEQHHLLVLTIHHIIADGWSFGVLQQELAAIYTAECQGITCQLPPPMQLSEYIQWEARQQESPEMAKAEAYWLEQFANSVPILELPTDRPRPSVNTYNGTRHSITLSTSLYSSLKKLNVELKSTLFTTLLASFLVLLHRLTGQSDIMVGIPSAGQLSVDGECLIGHYVNLLPIRSQIVINTTFSKYLSSLKGVLSDAYEHQIYPFNTLVKNLNLPRDPSRAPLVTTIFNIDTSLSKSEFLSKEVDFVRNSTSSAISDIFLDIHQRDNELLVDCEYNTDLFDSQTIQRWMGCWQVLLSGIVANPEHQLSELPLLTELEQHTLLVDWNDTSVEYPQQQCIHQLFEAQVERTPDAIAVVFEDQQLTYGELNQRANQLAHYLRSLGVKPEVLVGICVERSSKTLPEASLHMIIGLLGILKAGGAYVPLDPAYPPSRLAFMLSDSQVPVLLTQQQLVAKLPEHQAQVVCLDTDWNIIAQQSQDHPVNISEVENLAYVIYTSGSTGQPKGVFGLHRGAVNRFHWMWQNYPFVKGEVCCQKTSLNFVDSVWEIFGSLLQGVTTVIVPDEVIKDPEQFITTLDHNNVTRLVLVPSLLRILLNTSSILQLQLPQLKLWISSGEALSIDLLEQFRRSLPDSTLLNLYGSSEVSGDVSCYSLSPQAPLPESVLIGRAIANTQIYILDTSRQPVPIGVPGELYIGGDGLARGYLNQPELTAEKFISNPFSNKLAARLYKTGDLARYLPNGEIEYIGRIDHQVKIRGFRIELPEIEARLTQHPTIREAVVVVREDVSGDKWLVAYLVCEHELIPTLSELRSFLKENLPDYMVPTAFVPMKALPLTPNGKVDRQALPVPDNLRPQLEATYIKPQTDLEKAIAAVWQKALKLEKVGIHDNFFELGGHSLLIVQVHNQLRQISPRNLSMLEMFKYPTISSLAEFLNQTNTNSQTDTRSEQLKDGKSRIKQFLAISKKVK
ncbi:MAG: amino acid adenylation domain-containing protein [Nostoc sp.]|uniref:amino acid adenylation domain-containing protein n=1 Tax=Nostoc sp. TaxID=1180 RepID=UPI002FFC9AB6